MMAFEERSRPSGTCEIALRATDLVKEFGPTKVVIFNGHQNPETLLWGYIADQLGRGEVMAPFWRNGAKTPGVDEWVAVLGNEPILILLDELPSYLQMAQGEPVGSGPDRARSSGGRCPRSAPSSAARSLDPSGGQADNRHGVSTADPRRLEAR